MRMALLIQIQGSFRLSLHVLQRGLRDIEILYYSQARKFAQLQSKTYIWNRLTFLNKEFRERSFSVEIQDWFKTDGDVLYVKNTFRLLYASRNCSEFVLILAVAIWVNCAAISAVLRSSTLVKSYNSSEGRMISFERTKTNHDKLPRENNSLITTRHITLHKFA